VLAFFETRVTQVADRLRARLDPVGAHDFVSQDLLVGIAGGLDKQRWMIRAHRV